MSENIKRYAKEQQLNPNKAGEVVLAAAASQTEIGAYLSPDQLEAIGILPTDTKKQIIQKLRAVIGSKEAIDACSDGKESDLPYIVSIFNNEIRGVLDWLK